MPVQDQAVWRSVTVPIGGTPRVFERGELLPAPVSDAEANNRALLRLGGALRVVEVVFTPEEIAARSGPGSGASPAQAMTEAGMITAAVAPEPGSDPRAPLLLGPKPRGQGTKAEWVTYAVSRGMAQADAEAMTRDQLALQYRDEPG